MVAVASKRILVFCDSTGQDGLIVPDGFAEGVQPDVVFQHGVQAAMAINGCGKLKNSSNVWRLSRAVRPWSRDGKQQIVLYQGGVGSEVDFSDTYVAGTTVLRALLALHSFVLFTESVHTALEALGEAVEHVANKIRDAYNFIAQNFQEGDEILLFGYTISNSISATSFDSDFQLLCRFSKGAYVARKLASLIDRIGLLVPERLDLFVRIWKEIVTGKCPTIPPGTSVARIRCVGLWDTVGSVFQDIDALRLDDTGVPSTVDVALQALSIQENREHFRPILWTVPRYGLGRNQVLTQVWFPGAHGDVGGSYSDSQISDITLFWMTSEITRRGLLDLNTDFVKQSRKSTVTSWAVSQPHNAYMETPASRRQGVRAKNRYESDYINPDSVFHQSWRHSPTVLDNPSYMITQNTLQDAYGRDWAPTYAPLSTFEEECKEQWSDQEGVSSFVDEDVSSLIGQGSIYWTSSEDRQDILHERSIPGGVDSHGSTVYIGRASYKGGLYPGAFSQSLDGCHIPWNGNRVVVSV
ncbi:hypothetical protein CERSUDRAFT_125880 [Gelatoporia subvermispora B]|uniref:T6SS Phospholipase effector Tle1-like catalytic domain-containing protein n=1 Tax=Ceriporiopsis subvermispora (strain B) TaxID=914234 RepID=M2Q9N7_CERS8|nr:hypothetical protein CERSUDRAFT_125880 [Gelatoporia subvermispora B]